MTNKTKISNFQRDDIIISDGPLVYGAHPYTVQPKGCGEKGAYISLPLSYLRDNSSWEEEGAGKLMAHQFFKLRSIVYQFKGCKLMNENQSILVWMFKRCQQLVTFPKAISQAATSKVYFPKRKLIKCETSQVNPSRSAPPSHHSRSVWPLLQPVAPNLTCGNAWEIAYSQIATWEAAIGKSPLGKCL